MKAYICPKYGEPEVLQLTEVETPSPAEGELLVKVRCCTVTAGDVFMRHGRFPKLFWLPARLMLGLTKPKRRIPGMEYSGVIEAVGEGVTRFQPGDTVYGIATMLPSGSYAEYLVAPERSEDVMLEAIPGGISFPQAAATTVGALTALDFLKRAGLTEGQDVLIYGASGSVGTFAVQIAKAYGATVTGVCSTANLDMVSSIGADRVIDYTEKDFTEEEAQYDIIFDTVGKAPFPAVLDRLRKGGTIVFIAFGLKQMIGSMGLKRKGKKAVMGVAEETPEISSEIADLLARGAIKPVIDKTYEFDQLVEAHRYAETKRKKGNVIVEVSKE